MVLKKIVGQRIVNDVLRAVNKPGDWKVLIVDQLGMRIISACCKMHEIAAEGVAIVESLDKRREPLPLMEAIYLIQPTQESITLLQQDFLSARFSLYKAAHVFFTEACPSKLISELGKSSCVKSIRTLKELNIAFLPYESQVKGESKFNYRIQFMSSAYSNLLTCFVSPFCPPRSSPTRHSVWTATRRSSSTTTRRPRRPKERRISNGSPNNWRPYV